MTEPYHVVPHGEFHFILSDSDITSDSMLLVDGVAMTYREFSRQVDTRQVRVIALEGLGNFHSLQNVNLLKIHEMLNGCEADEPRGVLRTRDSRTPMPVGQGRIVGRDDGLSTWPKIGRNEPCQCGSGLKFKKCCGRK